MCSVTPTKLFVKVSPHRVTKKDRKNLRGGGGCNPKKTERYRKFQIWDWFFSVFFGFFWFFSVFPFWPILTGLTASCSVVLFANNSFYKTFAGLYRH